MRNSSKKLSCLDILNGIINSIFNIIKLYQSSMQALLKNSFDRTFDENDHSIPIVVVSLTSHIKKKESNMTKLESRPQPLKNESAAHGPAFLKQISSRTKDEKETAAAAAGAAAAKRANRLARTLCQTALSASANASNNRAVKRAARTYCICI